jgi:tetratricopeptide (TPR) repeat protein
MAAPTVTRPLATPPANTSNLPGGLSMETVTRVAKWAVLVCLVAGVIALASVAIVYWQQQERSDNLRRKWDKIYTAIKDKKRQREEVAALEAVAQDPEVVGSPVHAYILMQLGNIYFEDSTNVKLDITERNSALDKATKLFDLVASQEPYKSNKFYGPVAAANAAQCYEQARKYDEAIKVLSKAIGEPGAEAHYLYNPMLAELGRVYWLRSLDSTRSEKDREGDRDSARKKLTDALRRSGNQERKDSWREVAEYIKSLVDKPGNALPDGKAPPEKAKPAEQKADAKAENKAAPADAAKAAVPTPAATEKKDEPKKDEPKKDDKKGELKKDGKDSGAIDLPPDVEPTNVEMDLGSGPASPSGHLTFAQIQKALKEGRPAFCQCPRCRGANAVPSAARISQ